MALRMKNKYYSAHRLMNLKTTYDPMRPVIPGMQGWEDRMRLNELFGKVNQKEFDKAKERFFQNIRSGKYGKSGTPSPVIKLKLKHGDITVMDGKSLQKYFVVGHSWMFWIAQEADKQ